MAIARHGNIITASGAIYATDGIETLTLSSAAAAGDIIVAITGVSSSSRTLTVTDDRSGGSHTYTEAATNEETGASETWTYYTVCDAAVSNVTFTLSASVASPAWAAVVVFRADNGIDATPVGDSLTSNIASQASPVNTGSTGFTTTATSSVAVGVFQPPVNETWDDPVAVDSDTANCTNIIRYTDAGGFSGAAAYQILSGTKSDYSFNFGYSSGNASGRTTIVEFQEAAGGGGGSNKPKTLLLVGVG